MTTAGLDLTSFALPSLLAGCVDTLRAMFDEESGLFPYSARLVDGRLVSDYDHPDAVRYTINSLLGLSEAARAGTAGVGTAEVAAMLDSFLERQSERVLTCADLGLLVLVLAECGDAESSVAGDALRRLDGALSRADTRRLNMQDLGWAIWGACAAARHQVAAGRAVAAKAFELVRTSYLDTASGLPRHSPSRYRRNVVSFGSLVYFLRAMHEYAVMFDDHFAADLFANGVRRAMSIQGPLGEWPWMIHVRSGRPLDVYPVFSVHQDSMAMLFLLPAHDCGVPDSAAAIDRSLAWCFGANELSTSFYLDEPFFAYRSIERAERAPRLRRFARSLAYSAAGWTGRFGSGRVRLNRECRSYHLGWILFAWAGRPEARLAAAPRTRSLDAAARG